MYVGMSGAPEHTWANLELINLGQSGASGANLAQPGAPGANLAWDLLGCCGLPSSAIRVVPARRSLHPKQDFKKHRKHCIRACARAQRMMPIKPINTKSVEFVKQSTCENLKKTLHLRMCALSSTLHAEIHEINNNSTTKANPNEHT